MAIKSFADQTTSDIYHGVNTKDARRVPQSVWKSAQRKMELLHSSRTTQDLAAVPGNRFEPLKHDRPGFYSMRINDIYRVIFRFVMPPAPKPDPKQHAAAHATPPQGDAYDVSIENYHGRKTT